MFDGLLPPELDKWVMRLIYSLLEWHFLVKLRIVLQSDVDAVKPAIRFFGDSLRKFTARVEKYMLVSYSVQLMSRLY